MTKERSFTKSAHMLKLSLLALGCFLLFAISAEGQLQPQVVWTNTVGAGTAATPRAMVIDPSGNIIVAGYSDGDYLTAKIDPDGNVLWSARERGRVGDLFISPGVTSLALDDAGNVYVTGGLGGNRSYTTTICAFDCITYHVTASDQVTVKYDNKGKRQWLATYSQNGDNHYIANAIAVDQGGNVYVTGTATIKYNSSGQQVWVSTNISGNSLVLDAATNIYLGTTASTRKFDRDLTLLWTQPINGSILKLDGVGNLFGIGTAYSGPTTKLDSSGGIIWTTPFGGQFSLEPSGNLYLASTYSGTTYPYYRTVKLDNKGSLIWQAINDHGYYNGVSVSGVALDGSGNIYVTGQDNGTWGTLKYNSDGIRIWQTNFLAGSTPLLALDSASNVYVAGSSGGLLLIKYRQVVAPGAPVIAPSPQHPLVRPGDNVTLNANATGVAPLAYQWRTISGSYSSAVSDGTNATLPLLNVQPAQAVLYSVEVTNALGSAESPEIYVSILNPLTDQTVVPGGVATFFTPLVGAGPAAFQWQFYGSNLPGQTSSTLSIPNVGPNNVGDYTVVVSNYYGNVLTSTVAHLNLETRVTQSWAATIPGGNVGDVAQAVGVDAVGNVFVTGYSSCGYKTVKYNSAGLQLWEACDTNSSSLAGLVVDVSGNVCVAAGSFARKYSPTGGLLWVSHFDDGLGSTNDSALRLATDTIGNFYVTGTSASGSNATDIITAKYSPNGQQVWASRYDGNSHSDDFPNDMVVDNVGNVYVGGASATPAGYDFSTVKYNAQGSQLWATNYSGFTNGNNIVARIAVDTSGFVYVTGWSPGEDYVSDFATIKYNANGTELWTMRYAGPGNGEDNPHGLGVDQNGNVYVTGSSVGTNGLYDIATLKYAPNGSTLWLRRYSGPANLNDYCRALAMDNVGNIYVEGHSDSSPGSGPNSPTTEVVTLSYDSAGNQRWAGRVETGSESGGLYRNGSLTLDTAATVYVADTTFISGTPAYLTLKYTQLTSVPAWLSIPLISAAGQLRCGLTGAPGVQYTVQQSSNLIIWDSLTDLVMNANGTSEFTDTIAPKSNRKFYRAVQP